MQDLEDEGLDTLDEAGTLQSALACLRERSYDLVLTDWKMPGMDGIELVRQLQTKTGPTTPAVVMVSAYGRDDALGTAQQQQVDIRAVLTKPVTPSSLLEAIGEALHKGGVATNTVKRADSGALDAMAQLKGARARWWPRRCSRSSSGA